MGKLQHIILAIRNETSDKHAYGHKSVEYDVHTHSTQSSNHIAVFIQYDLLIGCFSSMTTNLLLENFMTKKCQEQITGK